MNPELILFYVMAFLMIGSALAMVLARDLVHGVLFMVANFILTAVLFLMLSAPFLAAVQLAVYAGAIMVLFLFVVMLLGAEKLDMAESLSGQRFWGLLLVGLLGALLVFVTMEGVPAAPADGLAEVELASLIDPRTGEFLSAGDLAARTYPAGDPSRLPAEVGYGSPQMIGQALFDDPYHRLPFELVSILLLVAMMGAVVIAQYKLAGDDSAVAEPAGTADGELSA
jgi:NADH-quinone oxidoreductase subunit J